MSPAPKGPPVVDTHCQRVVPPNKYELGPRFRKLHALRATADNTSCCGHSRLTLARMASALEPVLLAEANDVGKLVCPKARQYRSPLQTERTFIVALRFSLTAHTDKARS